MWAKEEFVENLGEVLASCLGVHNLGGDGIVLGEFVCCTAITSKYAKGSVPLCCPAKAALLRFCVLS